MTPDKIADAIHRIGNMAHIWVEGDHGKWKVTVNWGGAGSFIGEGQTEAEAYRSALDKIIRQESQTPGLHNLAAAVTPGVLGLPAECHRCQTMKTWISDREQVTENESY
jgi:hypothetical protein